MKSLACILLVPAFLSSCATKADQDTEQTTPNTEKKEAAIIVGRIASISSDKSFVLIQAYGSWKIPTGTILISQGTEGRTANLRVTGEKLGQYAAADLQSGTPLVGDGVIHRPSLSKPEPATLQIESEPDPTQASTPSDDS